MTIIIVLCFVKVLKRARVRFDYHYECVFLSIPAHLVRSRYNYIVVSNVSQTFVVVACVVRVYIVSGG